MRRDRSRNADANAAAAAKRRFELPNQVRDGGDRLGVIIPRAGDTPAAKLGAIIAKRQCFDLSSAQIDPYSHDRPIATRIVS
jgi:hypothetical protein